MRARGAAFALGLTLLGGFAAGPAPAVLAGGARSPISADVGVGPQLTLVEQTSVVPRDGRFDVRVTVSGAPADARLGMVVHSRVVSRGELATTISDGTLRQTEARTDPVPVSSLPPSPTDGSVVISLAIRSDGPPDPARITLEREGVYPVEVLLLDAGGGVLESLLTYLVLPPPDSDSSPPLAVSVLAEPAADLALRPDATTELEPEEIESLAAMASVLAARPATMPITLVPMPETLDALAASGDSIAASALDDLTTAAETALVLGRPYVQVDRGALVEAGLREELRTQVDTGAAAIAEALDVEPSTETLVAEPTLDDAALRDAIATGARRAVIRSGRVETLDPDTVDPARWFVVPTGPDGGAIPAAEDDDALGAHLSSDVEPALAAQRFVAEAAALYFERPAIDRGVVVTVSADADPDAFGTVLDVLADSRLFRPVTVERFFDVVDPLDDDGGSDEPAARELTPAEGDDLATLRDAIPDARALLASYRTMLPRDEEDPSTTPDLLLLAAQARGLPNSARDAYVAAVSETVRDEVAAVTIDRRLTVTLTAREGTIPITLRNDTGHPLRVRLRLDSDKLEFPDGDSMDVALETDTTRLDVRVKTLASGAFPLDIEITSPDGGIAVADARYTVRSTAVSGAGLVLSIGAGLFLAIWWARHWRDTRRSRRLVAARDSHPTNGTDPSNETA